MLQQRRATRRSSGGGAIAQRQLSVTRNRLFKQHFFTGGSHYWEVTITCMSITSGFASAAVVVGVAASENFECESLSGPDAISSSWANGAVGYAASGTIVKNGVTMGYAQPYREGDTVGVLLNMNNQSVAFFLNDKEQRPTAKSPWSNTAGNADAGFEWKEEQKQENSPTPSPPIDYCCFSHHSVFPALTYSVETDQVEFSMYYSPPKHTRSICM